MRTLVTRTSLLLALTAGLTGTARAQHDFRPVRPIQVVAHELDDATTRFRRSAEGHGRSRSWRQAEALRRVERLDTHAGYFHRMVERDHPFERSNQSNYRVLAADFENVCAVLPWLRANRVVDRDFQRVQALVRELRSSYETYTAWNGRSGYGDHRHDWDDRRYGIARR